MDSSYIVKGGFPKGVEYMGGSCTPSIGGGSSSKFDGGRLESIHGGRAWELKTAFLKSR